MMTVTARKIKPFFPSISLSVLHARLPDIMFYKELHHCTQEAVADRVHELVDCWDAKTASFQDIENNRLQYARLAVYEWVANLVQHADFGGRSPKITISAWPNEGCLYGMIEDNSEGFEVNEYLNESMEERLRKMPERGMGLLMIKASTQHFTYRRINRHRHRFEFCV